jgi:hypothetical protein
LRGGGRHASRELEGFDFSYPGAAILIRLLSAYVVEKLLGMILLEIISL